MGRGPSGRFGSGRETISVVRDGSGDLRGGLGRVGGPSRRFGTGRGTRGEVWDGFERPSERSGTGWETLGEVWDGLGDSCGEPGRVG